ncbi:DUF1682-domain-containing protein [Rhizoclosmatium globosum]|uniref:DUF1682-domain-containing protein n=1 Tax=Rhizoclosmatium globosum TaxID=329046 RepID=A0A1Y2C7R5_9FUNG|nr:DUF1682-domain-containing protein [Rhizoclosmatium globosum]|eukprot:ORY43070.1 DUF1682-domain-containing protein [Rhizoclosmatium globosum]
MDDDLDAFTLNVPAPTTRVQRGLAGIAWNLIKLEDFYAEAVAVIGLLLVLAAHFYTRTINQAIATSWLKASVAVWQANFAQFGDEKNYSLIRDGPYDFIFYASGREYVKKVYGFIKLVARYDPIGYIFSNPYTAIVLPSNAIKHDTVLMDFHVTDDLPNLFFAIISRDQYANLKRKRYDVADFGALAKPPSNCPIPFPKDQFVVLTDAPELANAILADRDVAEALWASCGLNPDGSGNAFSTPLIESIIITDQAKLAELPASIDELRSYPKMMHATFKIDEKAPTELTQKMVQLLMDVVDHYGRTPISTEGLNKLKKVRSAAEERILKKQEEARKRELKDIKYQAQKKKEEEVVSKMTPEEQRKYNEKKQKQELKQRKKSGKIVMG